MKTFLWSFILFAGLAGLSACDEDERVDYQYLPDSVHQFVSTYFSDVKVVKAEKKNEEPRYKVWLSNGFELKFYKDGDWYKRRLAIAVRRPDAAETAFAHSLPRRKIHTALVILEIGRASWRERV